MGSFTSFLYIKGIVMRWMTSGILMFLLTPNVLAGDRWNTTTAGGNMQFQGLIVAEACRVDVGNQQMTVNMGTISSNRIHDVGSDSNPVPFDIRLAECDASVSQYVGIQFYGVADSQYPEVLSIGQEPVNAKGIGIVIFDSNENLLPLNERSQLWVPLHDGSPELHLVAKYRATNSHVVGGVVSSQAWFSLTYL